MKTKWDVRTRPTALTIGLKKLSTASGLKVHANPTIPTSANRARYPLRACIGIRNVQPAARRSGESEQRARAGRLSPVNLINEVEAGKFEPILLF